MYVYQTQNLKVEQVANRVSTLIRTSMHISYKWIDVFTNSVLWLWWLLETKASLIFFKNVYLHYIDFCGSNIFILTWTLYFIKACCTWILEKGTHRISLITSIRLYGNQWKNSYLRWFFSSIASQGLLLYFDYMTFKY